MTDNELILLGKAYLIYVQSDKDSQIRQWAYEIMELLSNKERK